MSSKEFEGIALEDAPENVVPKCPACERELTKVWIKKRGFGLLEQKQIIMCPHCRAFLGYGVFGGR